MKKILLYLMSILIVSTITWAEPASELPLTLEECYSLALTRSETIKIYEQYIKETEGQMLQALSTVLPKVAFNYSDEWQDSSKAGSLRGGTQTAGFSFTQPLFTGFKEFAAVNASKHVGKQREADLKRARQLLFTDVSDAFYLYLSYQQYEDILMEIRKVVEDRLDELKKRQEIGKSRPSEVASAEAKLSNIDATIETTRSQKEVSGQLLEFLIDRPFTRLLEEDIPDEKIVLNDLLTKVDSRADIVSAKEELESYKSNITSARSAFFPTVSLGGNYYTNRADAYEGNDWDTIVTVKVPVFNGLNDFGQVAQAKAQKNEADLRLSRKKRTAILEIKNYYSKWQSSKRCVAALEKAGAANEKNYALQVEDFKKNLVNNLEVLQALEDWHDVRRQLVASKTSLFQSYWALKVAAGDIKE